LAELKVRFPKGYTKDPHERADENPFNLICPHSRARRVDPDPTESGPDQKILDPKRSTSFKRSCASFGIPSKKIFCLINNFFLFRQKEDDDETPTKTTNDLKEIGSTGETVPTGENPENRILTTLEKVKRNEMEKGAGWWNKYYASKAKLVGFDFL
jgi:hypothetical protein